jgi:plasmid stabilization system protein ParE
MRAPLKVVITEGAIGELGEIFEYVSIDSPQNAGELIERLISAIESLDTFSGRFEVVGKRRSTGANVHKMVVRPHIVYYSVESIPEAVYVHAVRHSARRQPRRFP